MELLSKTSETDGPGLKVHTTVGLFMPLADLFKVIDDPCFSNPCLNGGTCTRVGNSYNCVCTEGYEGTNCDRLVTSSTSTTTTKTATSGTTEETEDRQGPTGVPQPPFANISVQDFFGQSCELR